MTKQHPQLELFPWELIKVSNHENYKIKEEVKQLNTSDSTHYEKRKSRKKKTKQKPQARKKS